MNPGMQIDELILKSGFILLPSHAIDSRRSLTLKRVEAVPEKINVEVVEQGSEPFLSPCSLLPFAHHPAPGTCSPRSVSGACVTGRCSPSSVPFPPQPP